ncbi:hypothetical protein BDZ85DRAFT_313598 [Elsinoe ampelina]|uniref:Uncharacterized protein n=1 Tax=Elsinoe ampelina TaxID=302913 RepID=A0A6A6GAE8_9PEZI|nr:hypothetical protein BDZ85DRAFT_313598 [Elsinoe ampelina]
MRSFREELRPRPRLEGEPQRSSGEGQKQSDTGGRKKSVAGGYKKKDSTVDLRKPGFVGKLEGRLFDSDEGRSRDTDRLRGPTVKNEPGVGRYGGGGPSPGAEAPSTGWPTPGKTGGGAYSGSSAVQGYGGVAQNIIGGAIPGAGASAGNVAATDMASKAAFIHAGKTAKKETTKAMNDGRLNQSNKQTGSATSQSYFSNPKYAKDFGGGKRKWVVEFVVV